MKRRDLLKALAVVVSSAPACSKPDKFVCADTSGLSFDETNARATLAYADAASDPKRSCALCTQYVKPSSSGCGSCKVLKGPVHPEGTCKSFAARG